MNCDWIEDRLSAYLDGELAGEDRERIELHLEQCEGCRSAVSQSQAIGTLMRQSESRVDTDAVWEQFSARLDERKIAPMSMKTNPKYWGYAMLATAASIALVWFAARSSLLTDHGDDLAHQHESLAVDFQDVFASANSEPKTAIAKLVAKYQGQELDQTAATKYLGYEPSLFQSVPDGFTRVSTHVLNMPCCKCSATICARKDGTSLIVFEHKEEQPVWFGDSPSIETQCGGKTCKIVESAGQLAVSWKNEDRQLTVIGANDIAEVNQWVETMKL